MTAGEQPNDVAVSFVAVSEPIALELAAALAGKLRTFVYSERQQELAGREGMEQFTRVFGRDSRIVVVLHQKVWGQTPWTRVEQTAIQERGFRDGWGFLLFVTLDDTPPPDWLPKTRIWFSYGRFGMAGLAAVVEQRFQEAGGVPAIETAVEMAARLRREQESEEQRLGFLASPEGIVLAESQVGQLLDTIERLAAQVREHVPLSVERRGAQAIWLFRAGHTVSAHWHRQWANTLDDSVLSTVVHRGRVGLGMYANLQKPRRLREDVYDFSVDASRLPYWETRAVPKRRLSSRDLADEVVQLALAMKNGE